MEMYMNNIYDMLRVGVISSTHGIKGEVKVYPTTDDPKRFSHLKRVYLDYCKQGIKGIKDRKCIELEISNARYFKQFVILKFKGIDDINDVELYKGMDLYVSREDALPLEEGEYYICDLIGLKVIDDKGQEVGELKDVLQTGANDVYVVNTNENFGSRELLLPVIDECILDVDLEKREVKVHIMKGL
jgi:16S rRNA processing protein RimM